MGCYSNLNSKKSGFTLIEVSLSIVLFSFIFGALMSAYILINKSLLTSQNIVRCSGVSKIMIQNLLTSSDLLEVVTSSDEVDFKHLGEPVYQILKSNNSFIYLLNSSDFAADNYYKKYVLDDCGGYKTTFSKNLDAYSSISNSSSSIDQFKPTFINYNKCLDLNYFSSVISSSTTSSSSPPLLIAKETICGFI